MLIPNQNPKLFFNQLHTLYPILAFSGQPLACAKSLKE